MDVLERMKGVAEKGDSPLEATSSRAIPKGKDPLKVGLWVLIIGFVGFFLWAAFAPLDEGVPSNGVVTIATKSKVIEHLQGGLVRAVHVREGQLVRKGDILVSLDSLYVRARFDEVHQRYLGLRASEGRLLAEQKGAGRVSFHEDLLQDSDQALAMEYMVTQNRLFASRQAKLHIMQQQLRGLRQLVKEGYAPLSQQLDFELQIAQHKSESATQLAEIQEQVGAFEEKTKAFAEELRNVEIRSPVSGQVVGLKIQTVGAVIQPGQKIMDIVPLDESLLVEVKVAPHLIDRIHTGLIADVRFSSFANSPQLAVEGVIQSVSKDLLVEPNVNPAQPGASYYLALISITPDGMKKLGGRKLQPGMPVQAVIKTGERTFLTYILHPLIKRMTASMKEE